MNTINDTKSRTYLKELFSQGKVPTEEHFINVFDSFLNFQDDNIERDNSANIIKFKSNIVIGDTQQVDLAVNDQGSLIFNNNLQISNSGNIKNVAIGIDPQDAVNKAQLDTTLTTAQSYVDSKTWLSTQITDLNNTIVSTPLSSFALPITFVNMDNNKITNLAMPTQVHDAANKDYVDGLFQSILTNPIITNQLTYSFAINNTNTSATDSGFSIQRNGVDSFRLWDNATTNNAYLGTFGSTQLRFLTNNTERMVINTNNTIDVLSNRIIGIADGTGNNDAVNLGQLNNVNNNLSTSINNVNNSLNTKTSWFSQQASNYTQFYTGIGINNNFARSGTYGYLNSSGKTGTTNNSGNYSLDCNDRIKASEFNAYSSIKKKIVLLDVRDEVQNEATALLTQIPIVKYEYKDKIKEGNVVSYGIIAEQLNEVLPDYVDMTCYDFVPNIFCSALVERIKKNIYVLKLEEGKAFNVNGDKLKIIFDDSEHDVLIESLNKNLITIRSDEVLKNGKVFVYGTYEQCPTVAKQKLFELSMAVTQNLLKRVNYLEHKFREVINL